MIHFRRCLKERELLAALDCGASPKLQRHLDGCEHCRANLARLQLDLKTIGQALRNAPPAEFAKRELQPFSMRWSRLAVGIAAILLVISGGLSLWNTSSRFRPKEKISPETRRILDQFPTNPFLLSEAIAKELGIDEFDYFDAAANWETK